MESELPLTCQVHANAPSFHTAQSGHDTVRARTHTALRTSRLEDWSGLYPQGLNVLNHEMKFEKKGRFQLRATSSSKRRAGKIFASK
jgi:hypothetical protein